MTGYSQRVRTNYQDVEVAPSSALDQHSVARIFLEVPTAITFLDLAVPHQLLDRQISTTVTNRALELTLLGPTSGNSLPHPIVFVESREAKEKLKPALSAHVRGMLESGQRVAAWDNALLQMAHFHHRATIVRS